MICKLSELLTVDSVELYKVDEEDVGFKYNKELIELAFIVDQFYKVFTNLEVAVKEFNQLLELFDNNYDENYFKDNNYLNTTRLYYENKNNFILEIPDDKINIYKNNYVIIVGY